MKPEIKSEFVSRLRSGQYLKGQGWLRTRRADGSVCHCALGVLGSMAVEAGVAQWGPLWPGDTFDSVLAETAVDGFLPQAVRDWAGISPVQESQIVALNDDQGRSLSEIATWLEENA